MENGKCVRKKEVNKGAKTGPNVALIAGTVVGLLLLIVLIVATVFIVKKIRARKNSLT